MKRTTFAKVTTTSNRECYLLTTLRDEGKDGFDLTLSDGENVWSGKVSEDDLDRLSTKFKMDFDTYVSQTAQAFTTKKQENISFQYQTKTGAGSTLEFIWKKHVAAENITFQLGSTKLNLRDDPTDCMRLILNHCIDNSTQLQKRIQGLETDNERLSMERVNALKRLEKCVLAKEELEKELYSKFMEVLNSKKEKIRALKHQLESGRGPPRSPVKDDAPITSGSTELKVGSHDSAVDSDREANTHHSDSDADTDDEKPSPPKRRKARTTLRDTRSPLGKEESLVLDEGRKVSSKAVVTRPTRQPAGNKKQTPSKLVLPKVSSKEGESSGSSVGRKHNMRKSTSANSNVSSDNVDSDHLLDDMM